MEKTTNKYDGVQGVLIWSLELPAVQSVPTIHVGPLHIGIGGDGLTFVMLNPLTAEYMFFSLNYYHIQYRLLSMLKQ